MAGDLVCTGYETDSIGEGDWAQAMSVLGAPSTFAAWSHWRPYVGPGAREVRFTVGTAYAGGVRVVGSNASVTLPAASSGTATYLVCLRRTWGAGARNADIVALLMSGSSPVGRATQPGVMDDQPLAIATVNAGSDTIASLQDVRTFVGYSTFAPTMTAANLGSQTPGSRYTLADGTRYAGFVDSGGTWRMVQEPEPVAPTQIPQMPKAGTVGLTFDSTGQATIMHNAGFTPSAFIASGRLNPTSLLVTINVSASPGSLTASQATVVAKVVSGTSSPTWKPYVGNLSWVDWVAYP